ncbi:uncharacterized protein [Nicotiana tomentosiformis]|uniref:uncharacterized protein n=1 Tax=Nicotiana tomentosiformis TaxID=4098 RepID=UPI00388CB530
MGPPELYVPPLASPRLVGDGVPRPRGGAVDVVAAELEGGEYGSLAYLPVVESPLAVDVQALANQFVRFDVSEPNHVLSCLVEQSSLLERIKARQFDDTQLLVLKDTMQRGSAKEVVIGDDGVMRLQGRICVPNFNGLRDLILEEAHSSCYSIYPGVRKMYRDFKQHYWWQRMKKDIIAHVSQCLNYQQVKY